MLTFLLISAMMVILGECISGELVEVSVVTHEILSKSLTYNQVEQIYDNNTGTLGAFYSASENTAEVLFDLGKNHVIDYVVLTMKREKNAHNISLLVGNLINDHGGLLYVCERPDPLIEIYKCKPQCKTSIVTRSGIVARTFIMKLQVSNWISVYDMKVYALPGSVSEDISSNRLVLPSNCQSHSWLLTDKYISANMSVATTARTDIYFEKPYMITEIDVQFEQTVPQSLSLVMISGQSKNNSLVINLSDCLSLKSIFTCKIIAKMFATRYVQFMTPGLIKIFIRGKPVFYPKLDIKTSSNVNENLKMTCEYNPCDLSVHSDCSEGTIKSGVKFDCVNKRLIRMLSGSDLDSFVIVNHGKVEHDWKSTKFAIISNNEDAMSISMPRSYQYFGQYKCACIVADRINTEIFSEVTQLKEVDFLEDLFFQTSIQFKSSEDENAIWYNASNNIIYLSKKVLGSVFLPVKITMFSLILGNVINIKYITDGAIETATLDRSTRHSVKAFEFIPQSWSVETNKYASDEMFPDFIHGSDISIYSSSLTKTVEQNFFIRMLDEDQVQVKPALWFTNDSKTTKVNIMYASKNESKLLYLEKSCGSSNNSILATVTKDKCESKDLRLVCSKFNNSYLLMFKTETNFAKQITLDLHSSQSNLSVQHVTIKNDVILNQEDVVMKPRYINLDSSVKNKDINVIRVQIELMSKKVYDFIECGRVLVKIYKPNKDPQEMILQKSFFDIDVDMEAKKVNVTINVTIEGAKGSHETKLLLIDTTTFDIKKFELQEDKTLNILWHGIDEIAKDLLLSYELKIDNTILACNSTTTIVKSIPKTQTSGSKNRYQAVLDTVNQKHMATTTVTIQPVFIGNRKGQLKVIKKQFNNISLTSVSIDDVQLTTERTFTVIPSQSDIPCDIKEVQFNVTGINVEKFQWKSISMDKMKYKITNLVPGRQYQLMAKVTYKFGSEDLISKSYIFGTADDISILNTKHVAQLNERVNISCTADIGPGDKYKKTVEWLRADKSSLPDGVRSEISASNPRVAFIIMEKALADYSGEYGCFAKPSANVGSVTISIVVNDLVVFPTEQQVDFTKNEKISVTCSSSAVGDAKVVWVDPQGVTITDGDSEKYSIVRVMTEQNVDKAILTIKSASLATTGTYKCHKSVGDIKANKEFFLFGNEKLWIESLPMNSSYVGEKSQFRCRSIIGIKTQKVVWEIPSTKANLESFVNTSYPNPSDFTIQDIEFINSLDLHQVTCRLSPPLKSDSDILSTSFQVKLQSKVVINGPNEVNAGTTVQLTCLGYPDSVKMKLEWIFHSKNTTTMGKVIKTSQNPSSIELYKPIRLELNLTDVKENEAGRYECKFNSEARSVGPMSGKSISLVVNAVSKPVPVVDDNSRKSALSLTMYSPAMGLLTVLSTLMMFSVSLNW